MAKVMRDYTLVLTVHVKVEEEEDEINHDWLYEALEAMFPESQQQTTPVKIEAKITRRTLNRDY